MNRVASFLLLGSIGMALSACALFGDEEPMYTSGTIEENIVTVTAKVVAIDHSSRRVSLLTEDGRKVSFEAGPEVRNLDQVDVGDFVRASYYESLVYQLRKPGDAAPGVQVAQEVARAEPGAKPGAGAARMATVTATVVALDGKAPSVTFETPDGERTTIAVRDPDRLKGVRVGDLVEFTYTQAVAIGVEEIQD